MEAAALYYLAAQHHVDALAIMTISDSLVNPDEVYNCRRTPKYLYRYDEGWFGNIDCRLKGRLYLE